MNSSFIVNNFNLAILPIKSTLESLSMFGRDWAHLARFNQK